MRKSFFFICLTILLNLTTLSMGQGDPKTGGSPGGSTPGSGAGDETTERAHRKRAEELKRKREVETARRIEAAKRDYQNSVRGISAEARKLLSNPIFVTVQSRVDSYPQAKKYLDDALVLFKKIIANESSVEGILNPDQGLAMVNEIEREYNIAFNDFYKAQKVIYVADNKTAIVSDSYTMSKENLLFAQVAKDNLLKTSKDLIERTSDPSLSWDQATSTAAQGIKHFATLIKNHLSSFTILKMPKVAEPISEIDVNEAFIEKPIHYYSNYGTPQILPKDAFLDAFKVTGYQELMKNSEVAIIPDKIILTEDDPKTWEAMKKDRIKLKNHINGQFGKLNDLIVRMDKIIDTSNQKQKEKLYNVIDNYLKQ